MNYYENEHELEVEVGGSLVLVEVEIDWDAETLNALKVCLSVGDDYGDPIDDPQGWVDQHSAAAVWGEAERCEDVYAQVDSDDRAVRRAEAGHAQ